MPKEKVDRRVTEEQRIFAKNLVAGMPLYDAYVAAYMNGSTPERTASNYTKKQIQNRASVMKNSKGVRSLLAEGVTEELVQNAGTAVWDRRKATTALMKAQERAEHLLDTLEDATQSLKRKYDEAGDSNNFYKVYRFGVEMLGSVSETLLKVAQELNKMYGLSTPEIVNQNAVQVIFGATDTLPKDKDLEAFEEEDND